MVAISPEGIVALTYTVVQLGLYPFVVYLILEMRDQGKRQRRLFKTTTVVVKTLLDKGIINHEEISGVNLGDD